MPQPDTGPTQADTFPAVCGSTHLFPGARCRLQGLPDPRAFIADPWPIGVDLHFSDAVAADAELRNDDPTGLVLAVPAYTTGAGTRIDERTWLIREFTRAGDEVELTIGSRASA
ncbi:hypothetical protein J7E93_28525 [Streptomyces sp. ISL-36]|uniref:hypothetical protein n=1 Tax=Streptomyces sp. ISL-36 TaxID=2819182 RepID=UPI001BEC7B81|nr:hypothetical protein [Streptomyces sp. ISL-36]MBT2443968.1 hypothetical protein [Streptomyces sp. ISL-36]